MAEKMTHLFNDSTMMISVTYLNDLTRDHNQVDKAMKQTDVRDVRAPNLIRMIHRNSFELIGIDLMFRAGPAGPGLGIDGIKPHEPHQPSDPFLILPMTLIPKPVPHLLYSESGAPGVLLVNQAHQEIVIGIILSGFVIKR